MSSLFKDTETLFLDIVDKQCTVPLVRNKIQLTPTTVITGREYTTIIPSTNDYYIHHAEVVITPTDILSIWDFSKNPEVGPLLIPLDVNITDVSDPAVLTSIYNVIGVRFLPSEVSFTQFVPDPNDPSVRTSTLTVLSSNLLFTGSITLTFVPLNGKYLPNYVKELDNYGRLNEYGGMLNTDLSILKSSGEVLTYRCHWTPGSSDTELLNFITGLSVGNYITTTDANKYTSFLNLLNSYYITEEQIVFSINGTASPYNLNQANIVYNGPVSNAIMLEYTIPPNVKNVLYIKLSNFATGIGGYITLYYNDGKKYAIAEAIGDGILSNV